jgi:hypothetical protein
MVVCGYLIHDFWATRHDWIEYPDQLLHHIAGIGICSALVFLQPLGATRFTGPYMLLETSTIFLNTMWMMKECGVAGGPGYKICSYFFLALFTVTRIFYMPYLTLYITFFEPSIWAGWMTIGKWALFVACGLQFFWYTKILALVFKKEKAETPKH